MEVFMSTCIVLAVGLDSWLLTSHIGAWRSAGYYFISAASTREAIDQLREGDFDLVLLGDSIPLEGRKRLIDEARSFGSRIPVAWIGSSPTDLHAFAVLTDRNEPHTMLQGIKEILASRAGMAAMAAKMPVRV
jgi:hypothetical protein